MQADGIQDPLQAGLVDTLPAQHGLVRLPPAEVYSRREGALPSERETTFLR